MKHHAIAPITKSAPVTNSGRDQLPVVRMMNARTIGLENPPICPAVFIHAPTTPTLAPAISKHVPQAAPRQNVDHPAAIARRIAAVLGSVAAVPSTMKRAAKTNDEPPTMARPGRRPNRLLAQSVARPPSRSEIMQATIGSPENMPRLSAVKPRSRCRYVGIQVI